jgi:hypothetical protein
MPLTEEEVELSPCLCLIYILSVLIMYPYLSELQENNPDKFKDLILNISMNGYPRLF